MRIRHLIFALCLALIASAGGVANAQATGPAIAGKSSALSTGSGSSANVSAADQATSASLSDLERENIELKIEARLKEHVSTQFATLVTVSLALFAILITTTVIFFALRTKDAAVAEARKGIEEFRTSAEGMVRTIRTEFEVAKSELESILVGAAASARAITDMRLQSEAWASNVAQRVAAEQSLSMADQLTLDLRSDAAGLKTADAFSSEDYLLLIAKHIEGGNWELVRELAASMRLVTTSPEIQSAGYFYEGTALFRLGLVAEAVTVLTQAVERFRSNASVEVRHQVAKAMNNRLVVLMQDGQHEEVLRLIPEGLAYLAALEDARAPDLRLKLLINKGNALSRLGRNPEAVACYDEVIADILRGDAGSYADRHAHALYNKGCAFAQMGKVSETVACLEESRAIAVTAATRNIATDSDFDPIRSKPTFRRFLAKHGISAPTASDSKPSRSKDSGRTEPGADET